MKNITFTYDGWMDGEQGEACMTVMVDDERAEMLDAAFNAPAKLPQDQGAHSQRSGRAPVQCLRVHPWSGVRQRQHQDG